MTETQFYNQEYNMMEIAELMALAIQDNNIPKWDKLSDRYVPVYPGITALSMDILDELMASESIGRAMAVIND